MTPLIPGEVLCGTRGNRRLGNQVTIGAHVNHREKITSSGTDVALSLKRSESTPQLFRSLFILPEYQGFW